MVIGHPIAIRGLRDEMEKDAESYPLLYQKNPLSFSLGLGLPDINAHLHRAEKGWCTRPRYEYGTVVESPYVFARIHTA